MKIFAGLALSAALLVSSASAATFTQTATWPTSLTDINNATQSFLLFSSIGAPAGSILTGVTIQIGITETLTGLALHNTATSTANVRYNDTANFDATDSANASDSTTLDSALSNSFNQASPAATIYTSALTSVAGGATVTLSAGIPSSLTVNTGQVGGTTASYSGAGTFTLGYSTFSGFSIQGTGGNNIQPTQTNQATALATVIYTYTPGTTTPEPVSMVLFGSGLLAVSLLGRKKFARK